MKITKILARIICIAVIPFIASSCSLFGLDLQKSMNYRPDPMKLTYDGTAYDFIKEHSTIDMSLFYALITRAGMEEEYKIPGRTYIVLSDAGMNSYLTSKRWFTVENIPMATVKRLIGGYIITDGEYHSLKLTFVPQKMTVMDASMTLYLNRQPIALRDQDKYRVQANNKAGTGNTSGEFNAVTSNINPTNGIIHVYDGFVDHSINKMN